MEYKLTVYGVPTPQGSMRAYVRGGKPVLVSDNKKMKPWRQQVSQTAVGIFPGPAKRPAGVEVYADFFFDRPVSVSKKIEHKTTKPDIDKLLRAILDALTGVAYEDDSQVIRSGQTKQFGSPARVELRVVTAEQRTA